jgi:hypothetical protein
MSAIIDNFASRTYPDHWTEMEPAEEDTTCGCGRPIKRGEWAVTYFEMVDNGIADLMEQSTLFCMGCHHDGRA